MTSTAPAYSEHLPSLIPAAEGRRVTGRRWVRIAGYFAAFLAIIAASITFFVFLGLTSIEPTPQIITWALVVNGALIAILLAAVGYEIALLWIARRRREAAAGLHIRIVALFSIMAVAPAIVVAFVANVTLAQGVDHWFSSRTQAIVAQSTAVANSYNETQLASLGVAVSAMRDAIDGMRGQYNINGAGFQGFLDTIPESYGVPGVFLIDSTGDPIMQAAASTFAGLPPPPAQAIAEAAADPGRVSLIPPNDVTDANGNVRVFVAGIVRLNQFTDIGQGGLFLFAVAELDPRALIYLREATENLTAYEQLMDIRAGMQIVFGLLYFGVALVVFAAAVWLGLAVANRLVSPIGRLIDASDRVAGGDLRVAVPVNRSDGDLAALGESFNKMTEQLRSQRDDLVTASDQIDSRRRFIEAVLSGVTAGVVGVDGEGEISVFNRTAVRILSDGRVTVGDHIADLVPELAPVVATARADPRREHRDQVTLVRGGRSRTINVRVTTEEGNSKGFVITLDDITDLVTAQRTAVWADVARRIAHEIKNPLTPIQLSAERLRRKFGRAIADDREIFDQCVDTIIRQVGDIGRMVDEFASFARMPKPAMVPHDLRKTLRDTVFMMQVGYPDIDVKLVAPETPLNGMFDERLVAQVFTNLIKNATEGIAAAGPGNEKGRVEVRAMAADCTLVVDVIDNGVGLPRENRQRLLEPYMTTREKGTGLGLAIVKKIVEEHNGRIELLDAPAVAEGGHGAMIRLTFPELDKSKGAPAESQSLAAGNGRTDADGALVPVAE
ncbi:MAG: ATP-binding protein [Bauldia sp.]